MTEDVQSRPALARAPRRAGVRVLALDRLAETSFELRLERGGIEFTSGQLINIHGRTEFEDRSYTVCSGERDPHLAILFKLVPGGILTPQLAALTPGDLVTISGPYGEFVVRDPTRPLVFFATGTGVAPCRSYIRTHAGLAVTLVHGARTEAELYYRDEWAGTAYHPCLTRESHAGMFAGRVTDFARANAFPEDAHYYLCGANEMIYEMQEILSQRGIERERVFTEAYYYRSDD